MTNSGDAADAALGSGVGVAVCGAGVEDSLGSGLGVLASAGGSVASGVASGAGLELLVGSASAIAGEASVSEPKITAQAERIASARARRQVSTK